MSQRPVRRLTIHRVGRTPENPSTAQPATNPAPSESSRVTWIDPAHTVQDPPQPSATAPAGGESLPDTSGGRVCRTCWAYAIDPDAHAEWHRELEERARSWDHIKAMVLRVFHGLGYITKGGDATTGGDQP